MGLIRVHTNDLMPMGRLYRLVLKYIYDNKNVTFQEIADMKNAVCKWYQYIGEQKTKLLDKYGIQAGDYLPIGQKGTTLDEQEYMMQSIGWLLREDETGGLDARKKMFADHGINYLKFYKIPEAYRPEDFARAREAVKKAMRDHPEDYN